MLSDSASGLLTCLSLIVAIGAQNAYLLRQGLRRAHVGLLVVVCILSDYVLITAGVSGIGAIVQHAGWLLLAVRWLGAAFLMWYGLSSAWRARRPAAGLGQPTEGGTMRADAMTRDPEGVPPGPLVRRLLALTWLNPHVYLDTVLLLGTVAATHGPTGRWWFGVGACVASTLWFFCLGFGARFLAPLLASPRAWQILDLLIAATMLGIAVKLVAG